MNLKIFFTCPVLMWAKWLKNYIILKKTFPTVKLGQNANVVQSILEEYVTIYSNSSVRNCKVGKYTYISDECKFYNTTLGRFCSIGPGVRCGMGIHPSERFVSTHPAFFSVLKQAQETFVDRNYFKELLPVVIGNDVWIGANAIILDGVKIGDGAIIGAGAVVTKDIEPYAIVGGVSAKLIRYRFSQDQIYLLMQNPWWDKDIYWIKKHYKLFHDINKYIEYVKK